MKNLLTLFVLLLTLSTAQAQTNVTTQPPKSSGSSFPSGEAFKNAALTYNLIEAPNNTWGYNILKDGQLFVHQPSIPGMPGHEGFKTKEAASQVAELVIGKIKNGEMPPTVTEEELRKLNAIPNSNK